MTDVNKYHVTRSDFTSPNMFTLNVLQPSSRVKVKAFLPQHNRRNLCFRGEVQQPYPFTPLNYEEKRSRINNSEALEKFKSKFCGK